MTLADALAAHAATAADRIAPEARAVLNRSIEAVVEARTVEGAKTVGDHAFDFTLPDHHGIPTSLAQLLDRGPVVATFYRGGWCPYCNLELRALQAVLYESSISAQRSSPSHRRAPTTRSAPPRRHSSPSPCSPTPAPA